MQQKTLFSYCFQHFPQSFSAGRKGVAAVVASLLAFMVVATFHGVGRVRRGCRFTYFSSFGNPFTRFDPQHSPFPCFLLPYGRYFASWQPARWSHPVATFIFQPVLATISFNMPRFTGHVAPQKLPNFSGHSKWQQWKSSTVAISFAFSLVINRIRFTAACNLRCRRSLPCDRCRPSSPGGCRRKLPHGRHRRP